jgi:hypothetical protein
MTISKGVLVLLTSLLLILLAASLPQPGRTLAAQVTAEPQKSLFTDDMCSAPCWFGLTPGISTSADVEALLQDRADLMKSGPAWNERNEFDELTGLVVDGYYNIEFQTYKRLDGGRLPVYIRIQKGVVQSIESTMNEFISLRETVNSLGFPDEVVFTNSGHALTMTLYYPERFLKVVVISAAYFLSHGPGWGEEICPTSSLGESLWVQTVSYYKTASDAHPTTQRSSFESISYSANGDSGGVVPPELWQPWFEQGITVPCESAIRMIGGYSFTPQGSVFDGGNCNAPCWYQLLPGTSTSADIDRLLQNRPDLIYGGLSDRSPSIFDPSTGLILEGQYEVYLRPFTRTNVEPLKSILVIEQGVLKRIKLQMNRIMTLNEVLLRTGRPDQVLLSTEGDQLSFRFNSMRIDLIVAFDETTEQSLCSSTTLGEAFWVDRVYYYAQGEYPVFFNPDFTYINVDEYSGGLVPMDVWGSWFKDGPDVACAPAIQEMLGTDQ